MAYICPKGLYKDLNSNSMIKVCGKPLGPRNPTRYVITHKLHGLWNVWNQMTLMKS